MRERGGPEVAPDAIGEQRLARVTSSSQEEPAPSAKMQRPRRAPKRAMQILAVLQLCGLFMRSGAAQLLGRRQTNKPAENNVVAEMQVVCHSDSIVLVVNTNTPFNGMLYAKDAANNPDCLEEFHATTNMSLRLPLKACGTLSAEVDDGIEFFNTVVVQPHMRLMTNQGKGYHIRCKYQTRERTIANTHFNVSAAFHAQNGPQTSTMPLLATASMPMCTMKIYRIDQDNVAEAVKVGDKLVMVIEIDKQDMYGMRVTNCVVRDGMNKAEQQLINDSGCPVDETIMPKFEYENNNTRAAVAFRAHKFPHTSSIYYQCNVRLCINGGGCEPVVCAAASATGANVTNEPQGPGGAGGGVGGGAARLKRFIGHRAHAEGGELERANELPAPDELRADFQGKPPTELSFDVYSGLYVSDGDLGGAGQPGGQQVAPARRSQAGGDGSEPAAPCLTVGKASLLVVVASLTSVALVVLIACQTGLVSVGDDEPAGRPDRRAQTARVGRQPPAQQHLSSQSGCFHAANFNMRPAPATAGDKGLAFYQFR